MESGRFSIIDPTEAEREKVIREFRAACSGATMEEVILALIGATYDTVMLSVVSDTTQDIKELLGFTLATQALEQARAQLRPNKDEKIFIQPGTEAVN